MSLFKRSVTELLGTFWLVLGGCGSAVLAASSPLGIGVLGVALAFGLTVLTMAFAIGIFPVVISTPPSRSGCSSVAGSPPVNCPPTSSPK